MSSQSEEKTLPFMDFPLEIRRMIWKECLPRRVIEFEKRTYSRATICRRKRTTSMNLKIPALAHRDEWLVSMDMCIIHASPEAGRRSGLFGLMGDAPVQLVDVADVQRITEFWQLWASSCPEDLEAECFFTSVKGLPKRVQRWREKVEPVWVYNDWFKAYKARFKDVSNPKDIWLGPRHRRKRVRCNKLRPEYLSTDYGRSSRYFDFYPTLDVDLDQFSLNRDHPFVRQSLAAMPRLLPKIMFRHCTDNCHIANSGKSSHLTVKG
ncbi:hypothetical protein BJX62DRAFT_229852 [Aspergillus germanicus]